MFSSTNDDDPEELLRRCSLEADEALQQIGIYMTDKNVVRTSDHGGTFTGLLIRGVVGRIAFGGRVQQPDQVAVDEAFEDLADQYIEDEFERRRRELGE